MISIYAVVVVVVLQFIVTCLIVFPSPRVPIVAGLWALGGGMVCTMAGLHQEADYCGLAALLLLAAGVLFRAVIPARALEVDAYREPDRTQNSNSEPNITAPDGEDIVIGSVKLSTLETLRAMRAAFKWWPLYFLQAAAAQLFKLPIPMRWSTRSGLDIKIPAGDAAWYGAVENFGLDVYGLYSGEAASNIGSDIRVFLDVGANIGTTTLAVLETFPKAISYAFEPGERAFSYFVRNTGANGVANRVHCYQAAIMGAPPGDYVEFFEKRQDSATSGIIMDYSYTTRCNRRQVNVLRLADVIAEIGQTVDLLKIDVEGAEYEILRETPRDAWAAVRSMVLEYHPLKTGSWRDLRIALSATPFTIISQTRCNDSDGFGFMWCRNLTI